MDADVFRTRIAPLLSIDELQALRQVSRLWQVLVDQLVEVRGAFGLRRYDRLTLADVRYAHLNTDLLVRIGSSYAMSACAGGELADLRWALATFGAPVDDWLLEKVARVECMELLVRDHSVQPSTALRSSCANGHLAVAQWLTSTFNLTADDARADDNKTLRFSCWNGHLAVVQWLVSTFNLTAEDARDCDNSAFRWSCKNGHLALAQWLASTFGLTAADARSRDNEALGNSCKNGHLAVAKWLTATFSLTADDAGASNDAALRESRRNGHHAVVEWLTETFGVDG
jgi:hypothetical protein